MDYQWQSSHQCLVEPYTYNQQLELDLYYVDFLFPAIAKYFAKETSNSNIVYQRKIWIGN